MNYDIRFWDVVVIALMVIAWILCAVLWDIVLRITLRGIYLPITIYTRM